MKTVTVKLTIDQEELRTLLHIDGLTYEPSWSDNVSLDNKNWDGHGLLLDKSQSDSLLYLVRDVWVAAVEQ